MRKIDKKIDKKDFEEFNKNNPNLSSIICFGRYLWMMPKSEKTEKKVVYYFNKFVDKDDYLPSEKKSLIKWLCENHLKK